MSARVNEILNRRPTVGFALGVVRNGSLHSFHSHTVYKTLPRRLPVSKDTIFRIASITRPSPGLPSCSCGSKASGSGCSANDYLRAYQLVPARASWRPATIRHLLTHTAGISGRCALWTCCAATTERAWRWGGRCRLGRVLPRALRLRAEPGAVPVRRPQPGHAGADHRRRDRGPFRAISASTSSSPLAWPTPRSSGPKSTTPGSQPAISSAPAAPKSSRP